MVNETGPDTAPEAPKVEKPKAPADPPKEAAPLGTPEKKIVDRIDQDGDEDKVLQDIAERQTPQDQHQKESEWPMGVRKSIEVNGKKWEYLEYGNPDGVPVLNVHGWLGSSAEGNDRLARALAGEVQDSAGMQTLDQDLPKGAAKVRGLVQGFKGRFHIISPELPGFGKSDALDNPTVDAMADELAGFQKALGQEKAVTFGSSAGAILVTKMAARHPEAVSALILQGIITRPEDMQEIAYIGARIATSLPIMIEKPDNMSRALFVGARIATHLPIRSVLERFPKLAQGTVFKTTISGNEEFKNADEATQKLILDSAKQADVHTALETLSEIGKNIEEDVKKVQAPVVVLDGDNGDLVPIKTEKEVAGRYHPEAGDTLREKVHKRKVVFFQVGGVAGEHAHNVINSFPEEVAVLINHSVDFFEREGKVGGRGPKKPEESATTTE